MCSITEPRRATVSCKNLFTSPTTNERSRRHHHPPGNPHPKRPPYQQQQQQPNNPSKQSNVFHIPFAIETRDDLKSLRKPLNPLSPAFHSTRQSSLTFEAMKVK